jgi:hypothetical protein
MTIQLMIRKHPADTFRHPLRLSRNNLFDAGKSTREMNGR